MITVEFNAINKEALANLEKELNFKSEEIVKYLLEINNGSFENLSIGTANPSGENKTKLGIDDNDSEKLGTEILFSEFENRIRNGKFQNLFCV